MAEEQTLAQIDAEKTQTAEEGIADFLFGKEEVEEEVEEEYEPGPNIVEEGEDSEEVEASDEEVEASEEGEVPFVEVEFDGKLYEVPPELKDALLRQSDYTTKTQEVAQQRKEVEVIQGQLRQQREAFEFAESIRGDVLRAEQLENTAQQYHEYLRNNIDNLSSTDIEKLRMAIEEARRERDEIGHSVTSKQQEFQQAQQQSITELLNKGTEVLRSKIPGWGEDHQKQVRDYATNLGFSEAEINSVIDPRQVEVLYKAAQYDALQANKPAAVKKVQKAPTIKPRARDPETGQFVKQQRQLKQALKSDKLSANEKAKLIGNDIAGRFFS
jgi:hypothetical protein